MPSKSYIEVYIPVGLPNLEKAIQEAAEKEGIKKNEWIRGAILAALPDRLRKFATRKEAG